MEHVSFEAVEASRLCGDGEVRALTDPLGLENAAINHYRVPPGRDLPAGLHAHEDQEEVFLVQDGVAIFETMDGEQRVEAGEAIRFAPGEFQSGGNGGDEDLLVLAVGAPRDSEDVRLPAACPDCGHDDLRLEGDGGVVFVCPDCAAEHVPADCPECGGEGMGMTLGEDGKPVAACRDCGATFPEPPLTE
jgi:uncharacterized cupin superfamily protein